MSSYGDTNKPLGQHENGNKDGNEKEPKNEEVELEELYKQMPITDETRCGIGCFRGRWLQSMANKKMFITLYGITGCFLSSSAAYSNGTITTIEKRFKIPSRMTGIISIGYDIAQLFASVLISYYGGKGHRPRWIAVGLYCVAASCFLTAMPHFIYGPGEDALMLTVEYGNTSFNENDTSFLSSNQLCLTNEEPNCETRGENISLLPQVLLFAGQLMAGIGGTIYYSVGFSYMDDNVKKSKSPLVITFSYFIRTLGPPMGYALVSACLKMYISPYLTPVVDNKDPRWMGAWWLGWILLGVVIIVTGSILALLPRTLPRAAARKEIFRQKSKESKNAEPAKPSLTDMINALKRITKNKIYLYSHLATIFYVFGYIPFWMYLPKYIEVEYRQSASASSFATGAVGLVCSALGILVSGIYIQRFKPSSRVMAAWNLFIGAVAMSGVFAYAFLGCAEVDMQFNMIKSNSMNANTSCTAGCECEFSKYSPVCAADGSSTFISACHAGCTLDLRASNGTKIFTNCSCVDPSTYNIFLNDTNFSDLILTAYPGLSTDGYPSGGVARSGPCPVDCLYKFYCFLGIVCLLKFFGATGRVINFLISVRCVDEEDKSLSLGIGMTAFSMFIIPSPIVYGYIMDSACHVWGHTCSGSGNCWLYNAEQLRYKINFTSVVFLGLSTLFDLGVWFVAKTLNVYDEPTPVNHHEKYDPVSTEDGESEINKIINNLDKHFETRSEDSMSSKEGCVIPLNSSFETRTSVDSGVNCYKLSDAKLEE